MHWNFENAGSAYNVALGGDWSYNDATFNVTYVDSHDYAPDGAPEGQRFAKDQSTWAENLSLIYTFRGIPCVYYGSEIEFKKDGLMQNRANDVLKDANALLKEIEKNGLFLTLEKGIFGGVKRPVDGGKGLNGVVVKDDKYYNPFIELMLNR